MQFPRTTLIAVIDAALETDRVNTDLRKTRSTYVRDDHYNEWMETHFGLWKDYRNALSALLKRGHAITSADLPKRPEVFEPLRENLDRGPSAALARVKDDLPVLGYNVRSELAAIKAVLEATTDETVTDNNLTRLGFGTRAVALIFRSAAVAVKA